MKKSRNPKNNVPPEVFQDHMVVWFGPDIPACLKPREPEGPTFGDGVPAWLRELVESWWPVKGCCNLFATESMPVSELGDEISEWAWNVDSRQLIDLTWYCVPGLASSWTVEAIDFGPSSRLYVEWREILFTCLLAYSDDPDPGRADRNALRALFRENGADFNRILMIGAPDEASGSEHVPDELLVELLASGFGRGGWWGRYPDDPVALAWKIVGAGRGR